MHFIMYKDKKKRLGVSNIQKRELTLATKLENNAKIEVNTSTLT